MKQSFSHKNNTIPSVFMALGVIGLTAFMSSCESSDNTDLDSTEHSTKELTTDDDRVVFDATASLSSQFGPAVSPGRVLTTADMTTNTPQIPSDIYRPSPTEGPDHADLATFAWLEFISLVSPAGSVRGESGGSFETSGKNPKTVGVWETFQHRAELFPFVAGNTQGRPPAPWDLPPSYQMSYTDANGATQKVDIPYSNYNNLDETTQIGMNNLFFPIDPSTMDPEHDFEVLFEAKVNQKEWDFVHQNYPLFANFDANFPNGIDFESGTIETKATWRPINSIDASERYRYHTTTAIYYTGEEDNPIATTGEYALIGLHIIHKTPNFPTFIFATFEQLDNLRANSGNETGLYYVPSYKDITYSLPTTTAITHPSATVNNPTYPAGWLNQPYAEPKTGTKVNLPIGAVTTIPGSQIINLTGGGTVTGIPVTQPESAVNAHVSNVNQQAWTAMAGIPGFDQNFVWQYYGLKGVQGVPTDDETADDYYLANIVTESSQPGLQLFTGGQSVDRPNNDQEIIGTLAIPRNQANVKDKAQGGHVLNQGGCLGCHGIAQTGSGFDFSFLYFSRTSGFSPEVAGLPSDDLRATQAEKYMMMLNPNK